MADSANTLNFKPGPAGQLLVDLKGDWCLSSGTRQGRALKEELTSGNYNTLAFDSGQLGAWDSSLLVLLKGLCRFCEKNNIEFKLDTLPPGVQKLMDLSSRTPMREDTVSEGGSFSLFYKAGTLSIAFYTSLLDILAFIGLSAISFCRALVGKSQTRWQDFWYIIQQVGVEALPIVSLISFLVGVILAFVGAVQLKKFGATIYVADLVGLAMVREMGAVMTAIIMCGRTGAAFAATIGTMKVNEEIDALTTTGISPIDFVVLPRVLAMSLMMPLLVIFANCIGIVGGFFISTTLMDISFVEYFNQTQKALSLTDISTGLYKSVAFGVLVAITGCLRGMQTGNSATAVGISATSAVVTGITSIIIADAFFAFLFDALGI